MTVRLEPGDCLDTMRRLAAEGVLLDSVVTDPPYHLTSIVKRFGAENAAPAKHGTDGAYARASAGFMGKVWDGGDVAFRPETWRLVYDLMKPGAHLVAFGGTRTFARMFVAIEDAGFEVRDTVLDLLSGDARFGHFLRGLSDEQTGMLLEMLNAAGLNGLAAWTYGSGFPKSHNLDGAYSGWGSALKPAWEPIVLARKPLSEKTVAANVLRWGTGAINIAACRVEPDGSAIRAPQSDPKNRKGVVGLDLGISSASREKFQAAQAASIDRTNTLGRWPANVVHDGSDEVLAAFPDSKGPQGAVTGREPSAKTKTVWGSIHRVPGEEREPRNDFGSAARFYYAAKASKKEREGSKHPTVKPVALIRWLARLVTPPGGLILDPFAGSGTLGVAALAEGFSAILCEREEAYLTDIRERLAHYSGDGRHSLVSKARSTSKAAPSGGLFGEEPIVTGGGHSNDELV